MNRRFNNTCSIVQRGMGIGISLSGLASAVENEGGIGTIAAVDRGLIHGTRINLTGKITLKV